MLGKNASQLRFGRVLVMFWSRFGHKHCQNANPTHSVIRPLDIKGFLLGYMDYLFSFYVFHTKVGRYFMHSAMHSFNFVEANTKFEICIFICLRWGSLDWYACRVELDIYNSYI